MKNKPLVTISTPCYNHEKYLPDYFESIIAQTYKNIELIIFDDASQDNSQKVIEGYLPKLKKRFARVVYIPSDKNVGLVKNCNEGIDLARGKYIIGFASDDIMLPTRVEENVKFLEEHKDYGMVYSDAYVFRDWIDLKNINLDKLDYYLRQRKYYFGNIMNQLLVSNFIPAPTVCIKKECFNKVGKYNEDYFYEDYDMWLKIAENYKIGYINKKLALYRIRKNSLGMNKDNISKMLDSREKIRINHIKTGKYNKKYVESVYIDIWKSSLNYYFYNNKNKFEYYYDKYKKCCHNSSYKMDKRVLIKKYISMNNYLYKITIKYKGIVFLFFNFMNVIRKRRNCWRFSKLYNLF